MQHALLDGRVSQVLVDLGDTVSPGQVLAVLDSTTVNQMAAETLNTKTSIEAEIEKTKSQYATETEQAKAKLELAQHNYDRMNTLFKEKIVSSKSMQAAETELTMTRSNLKNCKTKMEVELKALRSKLKVSIQSLTDKLRQVGVSEAEITKMLKNQSSILQVPVRTGRSGIVTKIYANPGEGVNDQDPLFEVLDLNVVYATADVYEGDMNRVFTGQKVKVTTTAIPSKVWFGTVTYVANEVDPSKRILPVRVKIANDGLLLKPDMFVNIVIQTQEPTKAILLPKSSVVDKSGHMGVFIQVKPGVYQLKTVKLGRSMGDDVEIIEGLKSQDMVVTRGAFQLDAHLLKTSGDTENFSHPTESGHNHDHGNAHNHGTAEGESKEGAKLNPLMFVLITAAFVLGCALSLAITYFGGKGVKSDERVDSDSSKGEVTRQ